jgi:DNA primase
MAHSYLQARGISEEQILIYRFGEGRGRYKGRVIVPTFERDGSTVVFFVSRSYRPLYYFKQGEKKEAPKYLNPSGLGRSESLFNLYTALDYDSDKVILTEGVFSAIAAGYAGIASYGKHVSNSQIELLKNNIGNREVVVCLDGDAHTEGVDAAHRISKAGVKNVSFIALPYKEDPDSLKYKFNEYLENRVKSDPIEYVKLQLQGKLSLKGKVKKEPMDKAPSNLTMDSLKSRLLKVQ